jgi:predicted nucleic acid-binding protein
VIILDASVAVKWYFSEIGSDLAQELFDKNIGKLVGPDLLVIEVCAAFVRGANMDKTRNKDARRFIADFRDKIGSGAIGTRHLSSVNIETASNLALNLGHPLKDCIYLALAMELECELVTCDAKFAAKAASTWDRVRVLGD